jgi:hypothetical protein
MITFKTPSVFLERFFLVLLVALVFVSHGAQQAAADITYTCKGSEYLATIESIVDADGRTINMERVPVSEIARPGALVWELWSHRDGETWSERSLLNGGSRKGVQLYLQGMIGLLRRIDNDKQWPESETILGILQCQTTQGT